MWIDEDNVDESGGRLARMARVAVGLALMAAFVGLVWTILKNAPTPGRHAIRSVTRVELPSPTPPPPRPPEPEKPLAAPSAAASAAPLRSGSCWGVSLSDICDLRLLWTGAHARCLSLIEPRWPRLSGSGIQLDG